MKRIEKTMLTLLAFLAMSLFTVMPFSGNVVQVNAKDNLLCVIFPFIKSITLTENLCIGKDDTEAASTAGSFVRFGVSLIFVGIIAIAVFMIIKAALKYIRAEGDESKVEEATKAIKNVFLGVGALIVGIIGLVILLAFFNATPALNQSERPKELSPFLGE